MFDAEKVRQDFPVLQRRINNKPIVYFDNACMTLRPNQVIEKIVEYYKQYPACAGRSIHKLGSEVTENYENARKIIAKFINAKIEEIVFTKNTTESLNLVANSLELKSGDGVVASDREHNSNLLPWQLLKERKGIKHLIVKSKPDNTFEPGDFAKVFDENKNIKIVSVFHTSNVDGYTMPVKEIIKIAHDHGALVMLDGAQAMGHQPTDVKKLDVDFYCFSSHKMLGPPGGVLYGKYKLLENLKPFLVGGDTVARSTYDSRELLKPPQKFEAGLQDYPSVIGLGEAVKYLQKIGLENVSQHENQINKIINEGLAGIEGLETIGPDVAERGGITSFSIKGLEHHDIAMILSDSANIMVRSGQHCVHSWFNSHGLNGSVRISLYIYNTKGEAGILLNTLNEIIKLR